MRKFAIWLLLTALSALGLSVHTLQQQYEEHSAEFRILYRDVALKLSQHDVILTLLSTTSDPEVVKKAFPQILILKTRSLEYSASEPQLAGNGTYWLNGQHFSLLIDLKQVLSTLPQSNAFRTLGLYLHDTPLVVLGDSATAPYWQWSKALVGDSQPFELSAGNDPDWRHLPWISMLLFALLWAVVVEFVSRYLMYKRQRVLADLRAQFSELTRLNTMGEITAGMVHELNQPLTAILSYNQTALSLLKQERSAEIAPLLDAAVVQTKRISALLTDLRQKMHSDHVPLQPVNLKPVWSRVLMLLENELLAGKVKIINHIPDDLPPFPAAPQWVEQILHNLLLNAIQAQQDNAPTSAWVEIAAQPTEKGITLTLTDGGPGLSEQALLHVFLPFFTTRQGGLGLGMALTQTLVQGLNGDISAENVAGSGARFTLWFPFNAEEQGQ
ncbi:sensor histidine kinase [Candidatus Symbiopectobacterium sp. NZEC127]|uniref:sensor histidine kinase n=1 Tax=Candidatus Symbiopectobacterium sp. NZEC127 TaxID=2820472 RepID=UPI002225D862|nr:ATP-binding protein [Candidatus Symbiopectobacterium sp. NZEC127]MCW2488800.1 sensor histidine kinase [Candidatus Symbiopectobacterium sp. NZEC127]